MRFFLRSRKFKIMMASVAAILVVVIVASLVSNVSSPISSFLSTVTTPVQKAITSISDSITNFKTKMGDNEALQAEIDRLKAEKAELVGKLTELEGVQLDNEFYKDYLGLKNDNKDMLFRSGTVVARDPSDPYKGFTIDVGLIDGVALYDPIITKDGLVGYITEIAPTYSKVTTVLSPHLKAGGTDSRTGDSGVVSGRGDLSANNQCYLYNLQRTCAVSVDDYVVTAGGGVFPKGLVVGKVLSIKQQLKDASLYAIVQSDVDFDDLREVMVITYFSGQGMAEINGDKR